MLFGFYWFSVSFRFDSPRFIFWHRNALQWRTVFWVTNIYIYIDKRHRFLNFFHETFLRFELTTRFLIIRIVTVLFSKAPFVFYVLRYWHSTHALTFPPKISPFTWLPAQRKKHTHSNINNAPYCYPICTTIESVCLYIQMFVDACGCCWLFP